MTLVTRTSDSWHCLSKNARRFMCIAEFSNVPAMKISYAFDKFEAALKSMRAVEIAALGAQSPEDGDAAQLATSLDNVREAAICLWALPARGPSDLVLKARALGWHFPAGVEIEAPTILGATQEPTREAALGALAVHYIVKDLLALSE